MLSCIGRACGTVALRHVGSSFDEKHPGRRCYPSVAVTLGVGLFGGHLVGVGFNLSGNSLRAAGFRALLSHGYPIHPRGVVVDGMAVDPRRGMADGTGV